MKDTRIGQSGCRHKRQPGVTEQASRIIESCRNRRAAGDSTVVLTDYRPTDAIWEAIEAQLSPAEFAELDA